jgi:hypothetical protein
MPILLRLLLLGTFIGGVIGIGVAVADDPAAPPVVPDDPLSSAAEQTIEDDWTVIRYAVAEGDTLIIRLSDDALTSCDFEIHTGPRQGTERVRLGIDVDYAIVPAGEAERTVTRMARPCAEYWTTTD